ncbi:hypothetical protein PR048_017936 [Dryococelus australis]|uniref:Uncharacterized protein n=1 Tax=Dryococelus australis TaxID=614101 RepID=A0ABQ9HB25_9NEOP|nr:hypothetical protein PR048_017936 [Dryococelus australis]
MPVRFVAVVILQQRTHDVRVKKPMRVTEASMEQSRKEKGGRGIPEKTHRPVVSSDTIPTCENPGVTRPGIESGSPWWEAIRLAAQPPRPRRGSSSISVCMNSARQGKSNTESMTQLPQYISELYDEEVNSTQQRNANVAITAFRRHPIVQLRDALQCSHETPSSAVIRCPLVHHETSPNTVKRRPVVQLRDAVQCSHETPSSAVMRRPRSSHETPSNVAKRRPPVQSEYRPVSLEFSARASAASWKCVSAPRTDAVRLGRADSRLREAGRRKPSVLRAVMYIGSSLSRRFIVMKLPLARSGRWDREGRNGCSGGITARLALLARPLLPTFTLINPLFLPPLDSYPPARNIPILRLSKPYHGAFHYRSRSIVRTPYCEHSRSLEDSQSMVCRKIAIAHGQPEDSECGMIQRRRNKNTKTERKREHLE